MRTTGVVLGHPDPFRSFVRSFPLYREQDRHLPIANISRNMKKYLPGSAKIAKDAKEAVQECLSEFISFVTSECVRRARVVGCCLSTNGLALGRDLHLCLPVRVSSATQSTHGPRSLPRRASDKCHRERRKTIMGDDLLWAMHTLGFDSYIEPLRVYLAKFREVGCPVCGIGRSEGARRVSGSVQSSQAPSRALPITGGEAGNCLCWSARVCEPRRLNATHSFHYVPVCVSHFIHPIDCTIFNISIS